MKGGPGYCKVAAVLQAVVVVMQARVHRFIESTATTVILEGGMEELGDAYTCYIQRRLVAQRRKQSDDVPADDVYTQRGQSFHPPLE